MRLKAAALSDRENFRRRGGRPSAERKYVGIVVKPES